MSFNRFIEEGRVKKSTPDMQLVKSLLKTSEKHIKVVSKYLK